MRPTVSRTIPRSITDTYLKLVRKFPLRSIRTEQELDAAQAVLDELLRQQLDEGGEEYLAALTDLIELYEDKAHPIPDASEADVLRMLMESNGLTQAALARKTGIAQSTLSAVLGGLRSLTKEQILSLARYFHVAPSAFLPAG
jgi:HTH-type transcriptional regulator/antitoxin HigA